MDTIDCEHWENCGAHGCCRLGVFLNPSNAVCKDCLQRKLYEKRAGKAPPHSKENPYVVENIERPTSKTLANKPEPPLPSVGTMAKNVITAGIKAVSAGAPQRPKEEQDSILEICKQCEFWRVSDNRCSKCGCFLKLKVKLATEHCPVERW